MNMLPMQLGDVPATYADIDDLVNEIGFKPRTSIEEGIKKFFVFSAQLDAKKIL
jgi:UDP-glucuronate 4-epimerase